MNKVNITINSRVYTVVADEDVSYLERLCEYVKEKVNLVLNEGNHVMGEKPVVLAALNICDEYFKLLDSSGSEENVSEIVAKNKQLETELRELRKDESKIDKKLTEAQQKADMAYKMMDEADEKIKSLEAEISQLEGKVKKQRSEFAIREKELLDMLSSK